MLHITNPRLIRAIITLLKGEVSRESLDRAVGSSNSPEYIRQLRRLGLEVPCRNGIGIDRDGCKCPYGIYSLTDSDRQIVSGWRIDDTF